MFYDRYKVLHNIATSLCGILECNKIGLNWFRYDINILFKIAGYNLNIDSMLRHIENRTLKSKIFYIPLLRNYIINKINQKFNRYEISVNFSIKYNNIQTAKYDIICFLSMQTYFSPIKEVIKRNKDKKILILLPYEYKNWFNKDSINDILNQNNIDYEFIDIFFDKNEIIKIKNKLLNNFDKNFYKIKNSFCFNGINLFDAYKESLRDFIDYFLSLQIVFNKNLYNYLQNKVKYNTEFYITRDRRALENAFIQIGNRLNDNTNMIIHGMISKNHDLRYITDGSFSNVTNLYVWGQHDYDVIIERQKLLNENIPHIKIGKYLFFNKIEKKDEKYILFALQGETLYLVEEIVKLKFEGYKILIRLHPSHKDYIEKYKKYENEYIEIDNLDENLDKRLENTYVFISFYSTAILESLYNNIPTLIMNFDELEKDKNIFLENNLDKSEEQIMFCNSWNDLIRKINDFENQKIDILKVNMKLKNYFIKVSNVK